MTEQNIDESIKTIRLDKPTGAKRCGVFRRGESYTVGETYAGQELTAALATHLVRVKGFTANPAPKPAQGAAQDEPAPSGEAAEAAGPKTEGKGSKKR